jgi:enoyl-CoA hydratase
MQFENLIFEVKDGTAVVTVNRPKVLNALNEKTVRELEQAFTAIKGDSAVRCVLLTGAGEKAFVAGADINEIAQKDAATGKQMAVHGQGVFTLIETCGKPVIACVNGFALGGGCELAMACTMRIASENAKFGQPEVKLGVIPGYGGTQRLTRLVGEGRAMQLILTGEMISAAEALRIGLVNEVVAADKLMARGEEIAKAIAKNAPLAVAMSMEAIHEGASLPLERGLAREAELFGKSCGTADSAEGTRAFLEKRTANWKGE